MVVIDYPQPLLDTCGTGGDQQSTVNLSTAAAIVLAATGVKVAKHGNRAVSSSSGSSDVLSELGIMVDLPVEGVVACLEQANLGFIFAPRFHPRLKTLASLRKQLGVPTIFNLLGPLCNPARVQRQVLGVGRSEYLRPMAEALVQLNVQRAVVVHGEPGLDEVSLQGQTNVCLIQSGIITEHIWTPADFGYGQLSVEAIRCKDAAQSARSIVSMFKNEEQPCRPWVLANVAVGLLVVNQVKTLRDGVQRAEEVVGSGLALLKLEQLRLVSAACCRPAAL
jgi:anthranilate phosphoribosyltransferase